MDRIKIILFVFGIILNVRLSLCEPVYDLDLVVFLNENSIYTPMYSFKQIPILIRNDIANSQISISKNITKFYKIFNFNLCLDLDIHGNCTSLKEQFENKTSLLDSYNVYLIEIGAQMVGRDIMEIHFEPQNVTFNYNVIITTPQRHIDSIQQVYITGFQVLIYFLMGFLFDMDAIFKLIKVPIAVTCGVVAQYIGMPLVSFIIIKSASLSELDALTLFLYVCGPGGSLNNIWIILLHGDINLSVLMTFLSTILTLIFMPAWLFVVGRFFLNSSAIQIPYLQLLFNFFLITCSLMFAYVIAKLFPKTKTFISRFARSLAICLLIAFLILTFYAKYYIFGLISIKQWIIGPFFPWIGFMLGCSIAFCIQLPFIQAYTIGIETGLQNFGVAFIILMANYTSPESDYASLPLVLLSMATSVSLLIGFIIFYTMRKIIEHRAKQKDYNTVRVTVNNEEDVQV